jgi:hypothetical protein
MEGTLGMRMKEIIILENQHLSKERLHSIYREGVGQHSLPSYLVNEMGLRPMGLLHKP